MHMAREIASKGDCVIEMTQAKPEDLLPTGPGTIPSITGKGPQTSKSEPEARYRHPRHAELKQGVDERLVPV